MQTQTDAYRKVKRYFKIISEACDTEVRTVEGITIAENIPYKTDDTPPAPEAFVPFTSGDSWGTGDDSHAWFHFTLSPTGENTFLRVFSGKTGWDALNPQFILYINGKLRVGMDVNHRDVPLIPGQVNDVYIYAYTGPNVPQSALVAQTFVRDDDAFGLYYDLYYPFEMLSYLNKESDEYAKILSYLFRAVSMLELYDLQSDAFRASVKRARAFLEDEFYGKYCCEQKTNTICVGHTHIDCAWLWTLAQTREKVQRTFSIVLELMKRYPEYKFMSSQPLLYKYLREEEPELYEQVKERVREGRWECEGSMWVEADCNIPCGESLVRQVMYGKNFFRDEFGVETRTLWLPDVFGYSAALPQILRKSGVDWFVTSKISWNEIDRMPYDTFRWKGIDGTEINSYFLTPQDDHGKESERYTTYVGRTNAPMIAGTYKRYSNKNLNNEAILTYGFGDGGGGPTEEHLELLRRGAKGIPGSPNAKIDFAGDFLRRLEKKMENNPDVPTWAGELYLEFHRGTYTTQSFNKKSNRAAEFLYMDVECLGKIGQALLGTAYDKAMLHDGWETILTNQFHDIIPGSSIQPVYEQCRREYTALLETGRGLRDGIRTQIADAVAAKEGYVVFNPHSFTGNGTVKVDGVTALVSGIPSKGYAATDAFVTENHIRIDGDTVETDRYTVRFNDCWQIASIYDKRADREVLAAGQIGNELRVYADYPDDYDAWEWQRYERDEYQVLSDFTDMAVVEDGARVGIRVTRPYMDSTVTQTVWFYDTLGQIDFETTLNWKRHHQMLKAAFPTDINADKATYEIQFGTIERPTHFNTTWDQARFEVCGHKYADLSEGGYGVSLINDGKYGHDIHDGVMILSLHRTPTHPDPEADIGEKTFTYALCPHEGTLAQSDTVRAAYYLNYPMTAVRATGAASRIPTAFSAVALDCENVICETVKEEEYGDAIIVRMYECRNTRTRARVTLGFPAKRVTLCDLQERELAEMTLDGNGFDYTFHGFEITTFKVEI